MIVRSGLTTVDHSPADIDVLDAIQRRVLWLATLIVHEANNVRPNTTRMKVGGHQASSASMVSILTALYFHVLRAGDRVSVKPHASPAYHAVQYLLGNLPREYLRTLRAYKGLQAYPSRTKDPDPVDFSTGSVGLGAVAPAFAAAVHRYAQAHFGSVTSNRFVALLGDAELDEGSIWEAVVEPALLGMGNVLWVIDLNRQSLDRIIPGVRAAQMKRLFAESGWQVLEAKYGARLQHLFTQPGGAALQQCIDDMPNEAYQTLLRLDGSTIKRRLLEAGYGAGYEALVEGISEAEWPALIANLGGHDLHELLRVFDMAAAVTDRPTVIFAYTIKGWGLPIAGDPLNHSALLTTEQIETLRADLGVDVDDPWAAFPPDSAEGRLCAEAAMRLAQPHADTGAQLAAEAIPVELTGTTPPLTSTQEAFGRTVARLADVPEVARRVVTTSPDVSVSTNLAGWINKMGVFSPTSERVYDETPRLLRWSPNPSGQHIELGISEMNLFMLLGQLGLAAELCGQLLLPIGTVYDPFVCRGLDALIYGLYSGARFIFAGTPSGVTLAPEGGAHQSTVTPGLGIALPQLHMYEPCFAREVEWIMLEALRQCCDRQHGRSSYLRLSTRMIEQELLGPALQQLGADELRRQVLLGGYRLIDGRSTCPNPEPGCGVLIVAAGAVIPEVVTAARILHEEGIAATVLNITSADRLFRAWRRAEQGEHHHLAMLIPAEDRAFPIITVQDGASHALAWLGSVYGAPVTPLGVDDFGQSGTLGDLYHHFGLDAEQIAAAAFDAVDLILGE